mgnify:CR=1 FL=1
MMLLTVISFLFFSCNKHSLDPYDSKPDSSAGSSIYVDENLAKFKVQSASFRGVYINNFDSKIGNTASEDSVLDWCLKNNLNQISLYSVGSILTQGKAGLLNNFIGRASAMPYNISVSVVAASLNTATNEYNYYNSYPNKFAGITTEYEYWNGTNSFTTFQAEINYISSIHQATGGAIKRQLYISKFIDASNALTADTTIARQLVQNADRIFVVNYVTNAYNLSNSTLNKIKTLANASKKLHKVIDIVILFSVNQNSTDPNLYNYFSVINSNHAFADAYNKFKTDYNATSFANKTSVSIIGYQLYNYSNASSARP